MKLYFIYDVVSCSILRVFTFVNDDVCIRFLENAFKVPNSPFLLNVFDTVLIRSANVNDLNCDLDVINTEFNYIHLDKNGVKHEIHLKGERVSLYDDLVNSLKGDLKNEKK